MIGKQYTILAAEGMHARPATALVKLAKQYKSVITLQKGEKTIRLNSLLNLLSLSAKGGDVITLRIEGEDETQAAEALDQFFIQQLKHL